jgi:hypothetical protein
MVRNHHAVGGPPGGHPLKETILVSVWHFSSKVMDQAMHDDDPSTAIRPRGSIGTD